MEVFANNAATTLNGNIISGATTLVVTSASGFPTTGNFRIIVDSEIMLVTAVSGTTFTITRAQEGTSAAAHTSGVGVAHVLTVASLMNIISQYTDLAICQGRLTLTSGVPVTTSDVTGAGTIYFTPFRGNQIGIYDGTNDIVMTFSEISVALSGLTAGYVYDLFVYDNSGTLALDPPLVWTNSTTRATALALHNGYLVKSGDATRRYVGTFSATGTGTTEDSGNRGSATACNRNLWNYYNRQRRQIRIIDTNSNWAFSGTWTSWDSNSGNRVNFVVGVSEETVNLAFTALGSTGTGSWEIGIGLDTFAGNSASIFPQSNSPNVNPGINYAEYDDFPGIGLHYLQLVQQSSATATYFGGPSVDFQSGAIGYIMG